MHFVCIMPLRNGLLKNNDNNNRMTLIIQSTYSLHCDTLHLSYIHSSRVSCFELTLFRLRVDSKMRLIDLSLDQLFTYSLLHVCRLRYYSSPCPSSSSVFLRLLSFFLFSLRLFLLKVFQAYIGRQRKSNRKKVQSKTNEKESIQHRKKKETQLREKNEQWNTREKIERRWLLRYCDRNRFLRKGLSFTCPTCNLISVSERCAIRCYFELGH